ncbi:MAG TPA: low temperature requirement protein A [Gemmatimonadaceae bacterium]|nr:low temperature requirement protein A [Gemmatimonadaceae bacterium]
MTSHAAQSQGANPSNCGTSATPAAFDDLAPRPVTTIELFFDLVFVFTITQLREFLVHDLHPRDQPRGPLQHALLVIAAGFAHGNAAT